tara:strand:- start:1018 stop:1350 length:333 start_codon:yes stop_codon:yes gene_type:complete
MAESGQRDDNITQPINAPNINTSQEWKKERSRMLTYICDTVMKQMSDEEKEGRARASLGQRYIYSPDHELVDLYEKLGGEWTDKLEEYRPQPKSQIRMSGTMRDEIRLTR